MEEKSFLYFSQDHIIDELNIDPRLSDSFKRVMLKINEYFGANNYLEERNYQEYLMKYLLNSGNKNMRFTINKMKHENVYGYYCKEANEICINENLLLFHADQLDSTMCHEFIHFLVMHDPVNEYAVVEEFKNNFVNEALTEMLNQQIYPKSDTYDAQVAMQKYANLLSNKVNNFGLFLKGHVDSKITSSGWVNYLIYANSFQQDFNNKGYITLSEAQKNENFIKAQRCLINLFMQTHKSKTFAEYREDLEKLLKRPVADNDFIINDVTKHLDATFINGLRIDDENIKKLLSEKLIEVKKLLLDSCKYDGKHVFEFELGGRKFAMDENLKMHGDLINVSTMWSPSDRVYQISFNGNKKIFAVDEINFKQRDIMIQNELQELSQYFSKESNQNLTMIGNACQSNKELQKLEKFVLPEVGKTDKNSPTTVYVATYDDEITILNNAIELDVIENIPFNRYIGMTSRDPKVAAIYLEKIGDIEKGISFSIFSPKQLENRLMNNYSSNLTSSMSELEIETIVSEYKNKFHQTDDDEEVIKYDAIYAFSNDHYNNLSTEEQKNIVNNVINQNTKFLLSSNNGSIDVSHFSGDTITNAFQSKKYTLIDKNGPGLYNSFYDDLSKFNVDSNKKNSQLSFKLDINGNLDYTKKEEIQDENINRSR